MPNETRFTVVFHHNPETGKHWGSLVDAEERISAPGWSGLVGVTKDCDTEEEARSEATRVWDQILKENLP